jgi:DNA-directed RNA polymerase subunit RPC12/RpoP
MSILYEYICPHCGAANTSQALHRFGSNGIPCKVCGERITDKNFRTRGAIKCG